MATTFTKDVKLETKDETKKQRKVQAKKEAKLLLQVEQARKTVQKAEKKFVKAQTKLEERRTRLQALEQKHSQVSHDQQQQDDQATAEANGHLPDYTDQLENNPDVEAAHLESPDPAEGRTDISETPSVPQAEDSAVEAVHQSSTPPAEGRTDVAEHTSDTTVKDAPTRTDPSAPPPAKGRSDTPTPEDASSEHPDTTQKPSHSS